FLPMPLDTSKPSFSSLFANKSAVLSSCQESSVTPENIGKLINLIDDRTITGRIAKDVFEIMIDSGDDPVSIVDSNDMRQVSDEGELDGIIEKIIQSNPDQVKSLEEKPNLMGWFVGQVMQETKGKANPKTVNELLNKKLLK
ncbi:hypothetical protein OAV10_01530, partial [Hyphomicrobiales bacterium]|nr:hypothetical protein [Hyphomicrobiales bacterium]